MNNLKSFVVLAAARETGGTAVEPPLTAVAAGGFRPSASRQAMRRRWCTLAGWRAPGVARFSARPARAPRSLSDSRTPLKGGVSFSRTSSQQVASTENR